MTVNTWWVTVVEVRWGIMDGSCLPLFVTPVFLLTGLTLLNLVLRAAAPRAALSQRELLVVYVMTVISETLAGHDFLQNLFGSIGLPYWYATPENGWADLFHEYLPRWLTVSDPRALRALYRGGASMWWPEVSLPFLVPLAAWAAIMLCLIAVMLGINILISRHWTQHEKLAYPLVVLPLEMIRPPSRSAWIWAEGVMWLGFALAAGVDLVQGLHVLYPSVPAVPFIKLTWPVLRQAPWVHMYRFYYGVYPFAVALAFFIPLDLSFSCWFFFLLSQVQMIVSGMLGLRQAPPEGFPYLASQAAGSWLALAVGALLTTAPHLRRVAQQLRFSRTASPGTEEAAEQRLLRFAVAAIAVGLLGATILFNVAGMSLSLIAGFLVIFYLLGLAMSRVRAEFGAPHEIYYINPQRIIAQVAGTRLFGPRQLAALTTASWFNRCYRCHPMPFQLEGLKMAEVTGTDRAGLVRAMLLATVVGIVLAYWANLQVTLAAGGEAKALGFKGVGWEHYRRLDDWLRNPSTTNYPALGGMLAGALIFFGLRYVHFHTALPFHPAGYALSVSFAVNYFWFSFLISWIIKAAVLRYGGRRGHRVATRFFLGVLLGDYVSGSIWGIVGPLLGRRTYKIFI